MEKNKLNRTNTPTKPTFRRLVGSLVLVVALCWTGAHSAAAVSSQAYAQLRLLVEALYEIDSKYVTEKKSGT